MSFQRIIRTEASCGRGKAVSIFCDIMYRNDSSPPIRYDRHAACLNQRTKTIFYLIQSYQHKNAALRQMYREINATNFFQLYLLHGIHILFSFLFRSEKVYHGIFSGVEIVNCDCICVNGTRYNPLLFTCLRLVRTSHSLYMFGSLSLNIYIQKRMWHANHRQNKTMNPRARENVMKCYS